MKKLLQASFGCLLIFALISCSGDVTTSNKSEGISAGNITDNQSDNNSESNPSNLDVDLSGYNTKFSKRGICYNNLTENIITEFAKGNITWAYNWGRKSEQSSIGPGKKLEYTPMMWGSYIASDLSDLESWFIDNEGTKVLLGFNEPMMTGKDGGCNMTPKTAAQLWPQLETLATKYNAKLASPALTYGYEEISGTVYSTPEKWMDEFIEEYKALNDNKEPHYDYIALHSYMNWPSAVVGYVDKYAQMYEKPVLLTEFCAWGNNSDPWDNITSLENEKFPDYSFQQRTMTQKVEAMDQDKNVAGYAWFMADGTVGKIPNNGLISNNKLNTLGLVYTYMSNSNQEIFYSLGKLIPAVQYTCSSNYDPDAGDPYANFLLFDQNSDSETNSLIPLEIYGFTKNRFATYQFDVPEDGTYSLALRYYSNAKTTLELTTSQTISKSIDSTNSKWKTVNLELVLSKGKQSIKIQNTSNKADDVRLNSINLIKKK